jgi:hypothetical protein
MLTRQKLIVSMALVSFALPVSADPIVHVLASEGASGQQYADMDVATGAFSPISSTPSTIQYLVPGPNGYLLTMSFNGDLDAINPKTGAISVVGHTGSRTLETAFVPARGVDHAAFFSIRGSGISHMIATMI